MGLQRVGLGKKKKELDLTEHSYIHTHSPVKPYCYVLDHTIIISYLHLQLIQFSSPLCSSLLSTLTSRVLDVKTGTLIQFH